MRANIAAQRFLTRPIFITQAFFNVNTIFSKFDLPISKLLFSVIFSVFLRFLIPIPYDTIHSALSAPSVFADSYTEKECHEMIRYSEYSGALLGWYDRCARSMPWRGIHDPYRTWISEIMLQQTRVETVVPYYERFLSRFPALPDLAAAEETEVLKLWEGLGY